MTADGDDTGAGGWELGRFVSLRWRRVAVDVAFFVAAVATGRALVGLSAVALRAAFG